MINRQGNPDAGNSRAGSGGKKSRGYKPTYENGRTPVKKGIKGECLVCAKKVGQKKSCLVKKDGNDSG